MSSENIYEAQGGIGDKKAFDDSWCADVATTKIDSDDPDGVYDWIKE